MRIFYVNIDIIWRLYGKHFIILGSLAVLRKRLELRESKGKTLQSENFKITVAEHLHQLSRDAMYALGKERICQWLFEPLICKEYLYIRCLI